MSILGKSAMRIARQRTPGERRVDFPRGFGSETDPAGFGNKGEDPAGVWDSGGGVDWTNQPYSDLRLSPSGLLEPAGRFHRGATRGELDSIFISGGLESEVSR